jgi:predicted Kef-type K+ transport protein
MKVVIFKFLLSVGLSLHPAIVWKDCTAMIQKMILIFRKVLKNLIFFEVHQKVLT